MNYLTDQYILLIYSAMSLMFVEMDAAFVAALFTAVTFSSLGFALADARIQNGLMLLYGIFALFFPQLCYFLPLICYAVYIGPTETELPGKTDVQRLFFSLLSTGIFAFSLIHFYFNKYPRTQCVFLLMGILLALLLRRKTEKLETMHRRYQRTRDDDTELQILLEEKNRSLVAQQDNEIYTATLKERNRIAREIHDNVGHMLTRSILLVGALKAVNQNDALNEPFQQLGDTLDQAMDNIRQSVHDLHDSTVNLRDSLEALIHDFTFCPVSLHYDISSGVPRDVKYSLISIAKEALVNISRHSNADEASITAVEHPGFYQFIIEDNGTAPSGFGEIRISPGNRGMGLENMENRVRSLKGNIRILTDEGFRIYITIPKDRERSSL